MVNDNYNMLADKYSKITPAIEELSKLCRTNSSIKEEYYTKYEVNRGLRDLNGKGVLTGLTEISEMKSFDRVDGVQVPCRGQLFYRGIDVEDIVRGFAQDKRFGFEETAYLLIFGKLPTEKELKGFNEILTQYRSLPIGFVRDIILKAPSKDMMNTLARGVLTIYAYDEEANDISIPNVLRQSLLLFAIFPMLAVYGYQAYRHYFCGDSLFIHTPRPELSTAENILHMLRPDSNYTETEARILDLALVLHAEHGGGNNSTFTTHVVSSSGTDTYSVVAASLGSLKGPKHGGANLKVIHMFEDMKKSVNNWNDEAEVAKYLRKLLRKEAFDREGLIYGVGHAVYSLSDPRAEIFKRFVSKLAAEKGMQKEFELYSMVERLAPEVIADERKIYKGVSVNIDFYSGFVYSMLGIPTELFTPLFAVGRMAGWGAHRIEELINAGKIIRPAYKALAPHIAYTPMSDRQPAMDESFTNVKDEIAAGRKKKDAVPVASGDDTEVAEIIDVLEFMDGVEAI